MNEKKYDVIVVGAGASGLAAAYQLSLVNKKILVLEARDRLGGRIHSFEGQGFSQIVEAGAEFIHGKLPTTLRLIEKAGLKHHNAEGKMWQVKKGQLEKSTDVDEGWGKLMRELKKLKQDITIYDFPGIHFKDQPEFKESIIQFVEGYDAADAKKASALSLKKEWEKEDDSNQGRLDNGYVELINFLATEIQKGNNQIYTSKVVRTINWSEEDVIITIDNGETFKAAKVLITLPLGVLQADETNPGTIQFNPAIPKKKEAIDKMGFGSVIKINMQFENEFWTEDNIPHQTEKAGFIFSDAEVPTWWTQYPHKTAALAGWLAGPKAYALKDESDESLLQKAIISLAYIFKVSEDFIKNKMLAYKVNNWTADPFTKGAYSYATLDTYWAKKELTTPVANTMFFAGEALYDGSATGTVEGALVNGTNTAHDIIASFKRESA